MATLKIVIVTQARIGSSRFPEKVLQILGNSTLLGQHIYRLKKSKLATDIVVATTFEEKSQKIIDIALNNSVKCFQGSTTDVLDRFYQSVFAIQPDLVVRVTSDCPLIDAELIDEVIQIAIDNNLDYGANILAEEFPDGQDVEVFKFSALEKAWNDAKIPSDREHVTPYIRKNCDFNGGVLFKSLNLNAPKNYNHIRMTVDEPDDLDTIKILVENVGIDARWMEYVKFIEQNYDKLENQSIIRNEGYLKSLKNDLNE